MSISTNTTASTLKGYNTTLSDLLKGVRGALKTGPSVFNQSTFAGAGDTTKNAWAMGKDAASAPWYRQGLDAAAGFNGDLMAGGGLTGGQRGAIDTMGDVGSGYGDIAGMGGLTPQQRAQIGMTGDATADYASMADGAGNPSLTEDTMLGIARGDSLDYNDPIYKRMIDRVANETSADVNAAMGADGAYGSNVHVGALVDQVGGLRDSAAVAERQFELQRQKDALASIEGTRQQGTQNRFQALAGQLGGAGQGFGMEGAGLDRLMAALTGQGGAATSQYGMEQGGIDNMNTSAQQLQQLYAAGQLPSSIYGAIGAAEDADTQGKLTGEYDLATRKGNAKTDLLAKLMGISTSLGGAGGTKTTTEVPDTPWWQSVLSAVGQFA
jgi:hypothetical protein